MPEMTAHDRRLQAAMLRRMADWLDNGAVDDATMEFDLRHRIHDSLSRGVAVDDVIIPTETRVTLSIDARVQSITIDESWFDVNAEDAAP